MPVEQTPELDAAGIDADALQRLADACGPLVVINVNSGETIAAVTPIEEGER